MPGHWRMIGLATALLMTVSPAQAYLGPAIGASTLGVVAGLVSSIFIALFAVVWYPIKRMIKRRTARAAAAGSSAAANQAAAAAEDRQAGEPSSRSERA